MKLYILAISIFKLLKLSNYEKEVVFFSESLFYKNFYYSLFLKTKQKVKGTIIITSDIKEYLFYESKNNSSVFYIGSGFFRIILFNLIKCNLFITTLTDIGNNFNRSLNCKKYVYFFHSLASTHKIYTPKAFDNYDVIFVNGKYQEIEIRKNEILFQLKKKDIFETGYFYLEHLENYSNKNINTNNCILVAPSWNYNERNLFNDHIFEILENLIKNNFKVLLRLHPEMIKRNKNKYKKVIKKFFNNDLFYLDKNSSNISSMEKASLLITDNSTISLEFSLIFQRPSLYINYSEKIHNKDYELIDKNTFENIFKDKVCYSIDANNLSKLPSECTRIINEKTFFENKIINFKKENCNFLNNSSEIGSQIIYNINSKL